MRTFSWNKHRWFLLGLAFLAVNTWYVAREHPFFPRPPPCEAEDEGTSEPLAAMAITGATVVAVSEDRAATIRIDFDARPDERGLAQCLSIFEGNTEQVSFSPLSDAPVHSILIRTEPLRTDEIRIAAQAGWLSLDDRRPAEVWAKSLKVESRFSFLGIEGRASSFEDCGIDLLFNRMPDAADAADFVTVSPPVALSFTAERWYSPRLCLSGPFDPGKKYTVSIRSGLKDSNGQTLSSDIVRRIQIPDRPPSLVFAHSGSYLSPRGPLDIQVSAVNVGVFTASLQRVFANNLVYFAMRASGRYPGSWYYRESETAGLSESLTSLVYRVQARPNEASDVYLHLPDLAADRSPGVYGLTVAGPDISQSRLVVLTDLGLVARLSDDTALVWVNSLRDGHAVSGATVRVMSESNQELATGVTDGGGVAAFDLPASTRGEPFLVVAEKDNDLSLLALAAERAVASTLERSGRAYLQSGYEAFVYTECGVYRPGERGNALVVVRGPDGTLPEAFPVSLRIVRPDGRTHRTLTAALSAQGTAEFALDWPVFLPTGRYALDVMVPGEDAPIGSASVAVEDFVPPQLVATVKAPESRLTAGAEARFEVGARYLFGRAASGLPVSTWYILRDEPFAPTNWPGYVFDDPGRKAPPKNWKGDSGKLDDRGGTSFVESISTGRTPPSALRISFTATIREPSGRAVAAHGFQMLDVYPRYVGLQPLKVQGALRAGEAVTLPLCAVRPDGLAESNTIHLALRLDRLTYATYLKRGPSGTYTYHSEEQAACVSTAAVQVAGGRAEWAFTPASPGAYRLSVADPQGGHRACWQFNACSPDQRWVDWAMENPSHVALTASKESFVAGETASILVQAPFAGEALLTLESDRTLEHRTLVLTGNTAQIDVPISAPFAPNVHAVLTLVRPIETGGVWSAHRATGEISLRVEQPARRLDVTLDAPGELRPKSRLEAFVRVLRSDGTSAAGAEVTVAAVDEGILRLTDFATPDPLGWFTAARDMSFGQYDVYGDLMPVVEAPDAAARGAVGGDGGGSLSRRLNPVQTRRFKPVVLWSSVLRTDTGGVARALFDVPEFAGALRLMAVAIDGERFGSCGQWVKVKRPLVVQASLPRFLAPGDRANAVITAFNETDHPVDVPLSISADGPIRAADAGRRISLAAGGSSVQLIAIEATTVGVARVVACAGTGADAFEESIDIAVRPASPRTRTGGFASLAPGASVDIPLASDALPGSEDGGLWVAGDPAVRLAGGLGALLRYPYGCVEQTTSTAFPLLYLGDLAERVEPGRIGPEEIRERVQGAILRLLSMQRGQGGFAMWPGGTEVYSWGSLYATHFLWEAQRAGFDVPADRLEAALAHASALLSNGAGGGDSESEAWREDRQERAYACHILALAGQPAHGWMGRLREELPDLRLSSRAHLAAAFIASDEPDAARDVLTRSLPGTPAGGRSIGGSLNSDTRDSALLLSAWLDASPSAPEIAALRQRVENASVEGSWRTTQENACALLALGKLCRLAGPAGPPNIEIVRDGKSTMVTGTNETRLALGAATRVVNRGTGTCHIAWWREFVPAKGSAPSADEGIAVRRKFLSLDGTPRTNTVFAAGEAAVVQISIDASDRSLENIAIEDLLPAGLEIENPALNTAQTLPWVSNDTAWLAGRDIRDDRMIIFTGQVCGHATCHYLVRAVTPGTYSLPPLLAECMYDPSIRSVHGQGTVEVVP